MRGAGITLSQGDMTVQAHRGGLSLTGSAALAVDTSRASTSLSGSGAVNRLTDTTRAWMDSTSLSTPGGVRVAADNVAWIVSVGGGVAGVAGGVGAGASIGVNQVAATTTEIIGDSKRSSLTAKGAVEVIALQDSRIAAAGIASGLAGEGAIAGAFTLGVNILGNSPTVYNAGAANVVRALVSGIAGAASGTVSLGAAVAWVSDDSAVSALLGSRIVGNTVTGGNATTHAAVTFAGFGVVNGLATENSEVTVTGSFTDAGLTDTHSRDLVLVAARAGRFVVPDAHRIQGRFMRQGEVLGYVIGATDVGIRVVIAQAEIDIVHQRTASIALRFTDAVDTPVPARLVRQMPGALDRAPAPALAPEGGGPMLADPTSPRGERPLDRWHGIDLAAQTGTQADTLSERIGGRVFARFDHGTEPVAEEAAAIWHARPARANLACPNLAQRTLAQSTAAHAALDDAALAEALARTRMALRRTAEWRPADLADALGLAAATAARVLGQTPTPPQLAAALRGMAVEMATGEGKTLVAALAAAVAALAGTPVHVVTVNPYLAARDAATMTPFYRRLGLTCGVVTEKTPAPTATPPIAATSPTAPARTSPSITCATAWPSAAPMAASSTSSPASPAAPPLAPTPAPTPAPPSSSAASPSPSSTKPTAC